MIILVAPADSNNLAINFAPIGTLGEVSWVVPDTNGGGGYGNLTTSFATNGIAKTDGASTFTFTVALALPYTPKSTDIPNIRMSFDVANSLTATESGGTCVMYLDPPVQSVTISPR
mgnify:CR=1 FL=1